ncbi:MAG: TetR/AcrR family transcriptional regulator [Methanobacterium sp.]
MTDETKQKILAAALKLFSENGYGGTTTRVIAAEAGFTEMTLYTKFKTKQNLFNQVMIYGVGKLNEDASSLVIMDKEFEDSLDFLETCVRNLAKFVWNNFEFFNLAFNQDRKTVGPILQESIYNFSKYIEKHIPNQKIDYMVFTLDIFSFVYMFNLAKYHGPQDTSREEILEKFIYNLSLSIQ